jgi:hypothetical protein
MNRAVAAGECVRRDCANSSTALGGERRSFEGHCLTQILGHCLNVFAFKQCLHPEALLETGTQQSEMSGTAAQFS